MLLKKGVVLCFFDLPTKTKMEKSEYRKFRKHLLSSGYVYMQNSTYVKLLRYNETYKRELKKLKPLLPRKGIVNTLNLTMKEFEKMDYMVGTGLDMQKFSDDVLEF